MPAKDLERRRASARAAANRYRARHPDRVKASQKATRARWKLIDSEGYKRYRRVCGLRRKGLTFETFELLRHTQDNKCAICQREFGNERITMPHIDHDHKCCPQNESCGKCIRGLLCHHCNKALGCFEDNIERLLAAVYYLVNWNSRK